MSAGVVVASLVLVPQAPQAQGTPDWEATFRSLPDATNIREYVRRLSARPHHLGSPYGKDNAEWLQAKLGEWGWDARIETYDVLFPTPKERLVELVAPTTFRASLREPAIAIDPTSSQTSEQLPTFNVYSVDGDVTGPLVYVNYGRPSDYEELERLGVSVKGAIVIARYGGSWRGIKPKVAAEHGAIGCLIYSDPVDDGYYQEEVFPAGPMRPRDGVQRGSVADMPQYPGDPLTPGAPSVPGTRRLELKDAPTLTRIPVLPISYGDAQPLLAAIGGRVAPASWRGALPLTYRLGPGTARVHMKLAFNWDRAPLYNVVARIPGASRPDEWIIRGNHHDAWVNGAEDPSSGLAAELEEARGLGELVKRGWRPKRTLVYVAWDGEEPGLLGSTEWVEQHEAELRQKAVVYINSDGNGRGFLNMAGSHTLEHFMNGVARAVQDPQTGQSVWKHVQASRIADGQPEQRTEARTRPDLRIGALGSGSDYTPFLQHIGVPTLSLGFGGFDEAGVYHSIYDDFYHYTHFGDTDFTYGRALAQTVGTAVVRLADADLLPYDFTNLADTVQTYVKDVRALLDQTRNETTERNRQIEDGVFTAIADARRPVQAPTPDAPVPAINFAPLENAANALTRAAERYRRAVDLARPKFAGNEARLAAVNARLIQSEQQLLDPAGLPNRSWYRHLLYAPGFYTGYAVKTLPGVREAIEQRGFAQVEGEAVRAARALDRETALIEAVSADLEQMAR